MKTIEISSPKYGNFDVLIDDEDFDLVSSFTWWVKIGRKTNYACANVGGRKNRKLIIMHRLIMSESRSNIIIDHKNGNGIDNQKGNLRRATKKQNLRNSQVAKNNSSGFKGVSLFKRDKTYRAQIQVNSIHKDLGYFDTPQQAAKAYNLAAIKYFGEFAWLNPIPNG